MATTPNGKYAPLHNEVSSNGNMLRMGAVKNSRNSTTREMFLAYDDKMSVSYINDVTVRSFHISSVIIDVDRYNAVFLCYLCEN